MKMLIKILSCSFLLAMPASYSYGQYAGNTVTTASHTDSTQRTVPVQHIYRPKINRIKPIRAELSAGLSLTSNGWSFFVDKGKVKSDEGRKSDMFYNIRLWQLEIQEIKDPHELKSNTTEVGGTTSSGAKVNPFIYGKINNFYAVNLGYGFRKMIAGKPEPRTVSIHWVGTGGLSVGLLKPYYLHAYYNGMEQDIKYSDQTSDAFLSQSDILGGSGFSKGLSEIKVIPGIHVKTGLHFDFAASRKTILAVEAGASASYYTQSIQLMALQKAVPYFFNLYASFQFGKRW